MAEKNRSMRKQTPRTGPPSESPTVLVRSSPPTSTNPVVTIVGIGASAGGLEALEQFLGHVPPACGLAFVVVQHMDPTHKCMMVELLQRVTTMPVVQIEDRMKVEPDHVYVIPPNRDLSMLHGVLQLLEPVAPRGLRLPIDCFLRALADDQHERSIGVILSGMGSDGMLGLRAIKERAGAAFVQDPATAGFDGMPRSAIEAGLADVIAPAEALAGKVLAYLQHVPLLTTQPELSRAEAAQSGLDKVVLMLRTQTGHDFSLYKKSTLYRRIERRMGLHQLPKVADYVRYLRVNPQETQLLFKELLIGVTRFFRDPPIWEELQTEAIPALLAAHLSDGMLRAWTAGCSTGEEAYSLAIVFREALERVKPAGRYWLQIFATDLDRDAIDKARIGIYPANIAADVGEARLQRFFVQEEHGYRVSKEIREMVIFAPHNLVMDPPFTRLDLLTCRNLLIYLKPDLQKKLLRLFHYSLNPGGVLVLGSAETAAQSTGLFVPLSGKAQLYWRQDAALGTTQAAFPTLFAGQRADPVADSAPALPASLNLQALTDALLLQRYTPAAVLTTDQGDIVYISGKTGKYLELAAGKANLNVFAIAREGLAGPLDAAFAQVVRQQAAVTLKAVSVRTNGGTQVVDVTVELLTEPMPLRGMVLFVFRDVTTLAAPKVPGKGQRATVDGTRLSELAQQLQQSHEALRSTRERMQAVQEELKSANEELQAANEELQSTNEELTTSKEEMQSMNEELQTVNHELQAKIDQLSRTSDDLRNLLNSSNIATLFLDEELKVRRFTAPTTGLIKLIPGDTGRPITDLVSDLDYPGLAEDAREVLRSLVFQERQVRARDGRWFTVHINPYHTQDNRIDGVVLTFVDISVAKRQEATLREALSVLQGRFTDQGAELDQVRALQILLQKAQAVLEQRFTDQTVQLTQARAQLLAARERRP
jgi:two-component system CheB/CheR fusion protein